MVMLTVGLVIITIVDIIVHVAIDQVEPLRIAGNLIVLVAALGILAIPAVRRPVVAVTAGATNLALNTLHIVNDGIGTLGVILIAVTTVLCLVIAGLLARERPRDVPR